MGFLSDNARGQIGSTEYLQNYGVFIWSGAKSTVVANADSHTLIAPVIATSAEFGFGYSLDITANHLLVRSTSGNVRVYSLSNNTLVHAPPFLSTDSSVSSRSKRVAMGMDRMVIGNGQGSCNVYTISNSFVRSLSFNTSVTATTLFNTFGHSIAIADNRILVSMPRESNAGVTSWFGQVRAFNYNGDFLFDIRTDMGESIPPYFGDVVAIGNGIIAVGVPLGYTNNRGYVELFDYFGYKLSRIEPDIVMTDGYFGGAISIGSGILVCAYLNKERFNIYDLQGNLVKQILIPYSGAQISSIVVKYGRIFVGIPNLPFDTSFFTNKGYVLEYSLEGVLINTIAPSIDNGSRFGTSIAVGSGHLAVAANAATVAGVSNVGSVFVYRIDPSHTVYDVEHVVNNGD
jgi:hypothetical protein